MPQQRSTSAMPTWASYREMIGDRSGLFAAVREAFHPTTALYLGSYLDLAPSTAIPSVTYVDIDSRAARYFADEEAIAADLRGRTLPGADIDVSFLRADYTQPLPIGPGSVDLLISLFTTPAWDYCREYLKPKGLLLANASHGEASLAALEPSLTLVAAVHHRDGRYRLDTENLDDYLIPKNPAAADPAQIRAKGRGIGYTRSAFAYVFRAST